MMKKILNIFSLPPFESLSKETRTFELAKRLVQYYYFLLAALAVVNLEFFNYFQGRPNFTPFWPLSWTSNFDYPTVVNLVLLLFLLGSLAGALKSSSRWARILAFVGILEFHAFKSSFGQVNLTYYLWLYSAFLFIFLPDFSRNKEVTSPNKQKYLLIFWGVQALVLLTYSMSGLGKIVGFVEQLSLGQVNAFSPQALAWHIKDWQIINHITGILGPTIVDHPWLGWPGYVAVIYLQLFAFWAAIRPNLQRWWALGLIAFHIGTFVTMEIDFAPPIILLLILFWDSPFQKPTNSWRETVSDLPIFGWIFHRLV